MNLRDMNMAWLRAAVLLFLFSSEARASDWRGVFAYVDWTSDYRFYGISESNREPAIQGGLHWLLPDRFYVGIFSSGVRFKDFRNTSYEIDFYGGRHFLFGSNDLNVELLYSIFPNQSAHAFYRPPSYIFPTYNFFETSAELSYKMDRLTLSGKAVFSPAYGSHTGLMGDLDGAASYAIADWLSADVRVGRQWVQRGIDRTHWEVGATATWRIKTQEVALDLRYFGTDLSRLQCFGQNWCGPSLMVKATYGLAL
jgi:uncharacterized protein (TIGR02001 family)